MLLQPLFLTLTRGSRHPLLIDGKRFFTFASSSLGKYIHLSLLGWVGMMRSEIESMMC